MEICPAILTDNIKEFQAQLSLYSKYFAKIDIDINTQGDSFDGVVTPNIDLIIQQLKRLPGIKFNFHLMLSKPFWIHKYISDNLDQNVYFFLHQESDISFLDDIESVANIGICIEKQTKLREIEFYNQFSEIQLMTVAIGFQGSKFDKKILQKAKNLRQMGYTGRLSLDGGINLESAIDIRASEVEINRLSVGSYFSRSKDVKLSLEKLNNILI